MAKTKQRSHNEWFRTVSLGNRKSCPCCKEKLPMGEQVWCWGEHVRAKWHNVKYFCRACFASEVQAPLNGHGDDCGCTINLVGYHTQLPEWLTLGETCKV